MALCHPCHAPAAIPQKACSTCHCLHHPLTTPLPPWLQVDRYGDDALGPPSEAAAAAADPRLLENYERLLPCQVAAKKGNRLLARLLEPGLSLEVVLARPAQVGAGAGRRSGLVVCQLGILGTWWTSGQHLPCSKAPCGCSC